MEPETDQNLAYLMSNFKGGVFGPVLRDVSLQILDYEMLSENSEDVGNKLVELCTSELLNLVETNFGAETSLKVQDAIDFAKEAHSKVFRDEGVPYILHPLRVALILAAEAKICEPNIICAAILHDVLEDTNETLDTIQSRFGNEVALCVVALSEVEGDNIDKLLLRAKQATALGADLIRIADRIDNIRSLVHKRGLGKRLDKIEETHKHYVDFARWRSPLLSALLNTALMEAEEQVRQDDLYEDEIRRELKNFFMETHERVSQLPVFKKVTNTDVTLDDYVKYLKVGYGIFSSIENCVSRSSLSAEYLDIWNDDERRSEFLIEDMDKLEVPKRQQITTAAQFDEPNPENLCDYLALLYILRGSQLGGVAVRGHVEHELGLSAANGTMYLNSSGDGKRSFDAFQRYLAKVSKLIEEGVITLEGLGKSLSELFLEIERYASLDVFN